MASIPDQSASSAELQPAWDVALLFPSQGAWTEGKYLSLDTKRLVELVDGNLEVLPMPTFSHQFIVAFLFGLLNRFVSDQQIGQVLFAPLPMRIREKSYREPDIMFFSRDHLLPPEGKYLRGANLVMEVVSADDESHKRDYQHKRNDYAELAIPEYWIVDPQAECITVLVLEGQQYQVHGEFTRGEEATSVLLAGFSVAVSDVLAAGQEPVT